MQQGPHHKKSLLCLWAFGTYGEDLEEVARNLSYRIVHLSDAGVSIDSCQNNPALYIQKAVEYAKDTGATDGIFAVSDYPAGLLVPIVSEAMATSACSLESALRCQHKWWSRLEQRAIVPEAVPSFGLLDLREARAADNFQFPYPFWLKPIKSFGSYLSYRIKDQQGLRLATAAAREPLAGFTRAFDRLLDFSAISADAKKVGGLHMIAEEPLNGVQCTLEGYVHRGQVITIGIVDSVRYPNRVSFKRFRYPSLLPKSVQTRMREIASRVMTYIGFDRSLFNIEFFVDRRTGIPKILEINSRLSQSFHRLFHMVDGQSTFELLLRIAGGEEEEFPLRQGNYRVAGLFPLRAWGSDKRVIRAPSQEALRAISAEMPGVYVTDCVHEGVLLSEHTTQDSYSYRYARIHVGGASDEDIYKRLKHVLTRLTFEFEDVQPG